ncbi:MAG: S8 family serine peptidase [Deltaproteobacteria bacterium]|nr:S8 family serine peptidase [Deltaproteobacteria bacterium]
MRHFSKFTYVFWCAAFVLLFMLVINVSAGDVPPPRVSAVAPECAAPGETVSLAGHGFGAQNVTIWVGDQIAEIVKATGHSAEFLVPLDAPPGITSITVENPGGQGGTINFQVKGPEICGNNIDDDCDGGIDEVEECPLASIEIDTSPFDIGLAPGEVGNISTTVTFTAAGSDPFTIAVTQQVVVLSGPPGGISISPNVVGGFVSSTDHATVDNQEITALSEGVYEIKTTAEIVETGEVVSDVVLVTVESISQTLSVGIPGSDPGGLAPDTTSSVVFTAQVQGAETTTPIDVELGGDVAITLNDQGIDGDIAANDGTFSGKAVIDTTGLTVGTCLSVVATASQDADTATSDAYKLCVSSLPLELAPSDVSNTIADPESGEPAVADEVLITVIFGTSDDVINQIATSMGGSVVGSIPGLNVYQIKFQIPFSSSAQLEQILSNLKDHAEVVDANPNILMQGQSVTPSDTKFSSQSALTKIRADEAWTIARGTVTIAVVDSGVDLDHPDLASKIIKGKDFVNGGDPDDENGHGTVVAGLAAAATNNSEGIAGVSWGSKVYVVRVLDSNKNGTLANGVAGIKVAADYGARIINLSFGTAASAAKADLCAAVSYATGKGSMVVAAAMNDGNSTENYPAACPGAIAVGNTTLTDARHTGTYPSNYGSWVDLAAPGVNVWSTVPKGGTCAFCNSSGYGQATGTSFSAPIVAGAAAVILSRQPVLTNTQVETRLERTAVKLASSAQLGAGRIDLFEAVFNGSFEEGNLALWTRLGTASSKKSLGSIVPQDRERMGSVSTGPAGAQTAGTLLQGFTIQPGVTSFPISFKYAFVTEEYPEFVGTIFDDALKITLVTPAGTEIVLAEESVNASSFTAIGGIDFPGGDTTVGWTGWKPVSTTVPVAGGSGVYRIYLEDAGDAIYDTETLIDEIKFK